MKRKLCVYLLLVFTAFFLHSQDANGGYTTVEKNGIKFSWKINNNMLDCKVSAPATGWVSVGIDPVSMMAKADIIIGYVKDGKVFIQDGYGTGSVSHKADVDLGGEDNIVNSAGTEKDGITEIIFSIPLDSNDKYDNKITKGKHKIILAYSAKDDFKSKHISRTSVEIEIK